jgi:RNA polymerase sigma-70 factor, ECF subfamily
LGHDHKKEQEICKEFPSASTISVLKEIGPKVTGAGSQDELYQRAAREYGTALGRLAHAYEADPDRSRDLLQEIHLALWRSFEKFDGRCSLRTWIYRVAHNVATSHVIRQSRRKPPRFLTLEEAEVQTDHESLEVSADRQKSLTRLLALIRRLEPMDRQLMLAYLEGMDAESIAEITGLSAANIWTKIHRIKNVLTRRFHAGGPDAR